MIPRLRPCIGWPELLALCMPARKGAVPEFERGFAALMEQGYAAAFPYGRTGLACLLEALGIRDKEIICPAWTCVVVPHAIVYSGNEPVFVDSRPEDYNMDLEAAEREITARTGAIIPTSLFGHPVDLDCLAGLRARHPGLPVIQDCAHSFAASWNGKPVQKEGIAAVFGLNISKLITSIFGGMVTTDDAALARELCRVREYTISPASWRKEWKNRLYLPAAAMALYPPVYGAINTLERMGSLNRFVKYYDEVAIDMPKDWQEGMGAVQAAVGIRQLTRYADIITRRRGTAAFYHKQLAGLPDIKLPPWAEGATWSHYTIRVKKREELLRQALRQGIQLGWLVEYNIPDMAAYRNRPGFRDCPAARMLAREAVNLPMWGGGLLKIADFFRSHIVYQHSN